MVQDVESIPAAEQLAFKVTARSEVRCAANAARDLAAGLGFSRIECEEIALAAAELGSNLLVHVGGGELRLAALQSSERAGLQIVSEDNGPGIPDVESAFTDGYSTAGGLGNGLGAVNRLMDEMEFSANAHTGLRVTCRRWVRPAQGRRGSRWLEFGAASRPFRSLKENGDSIVIRQWADHALAGVIDGLGHGAFAQRAALAARQYLEHHFDQPLESLFHGAGRACHATRGVVMALVRFELAEQRILVGTIGNIEVQVLGSGKPFNPVIRRGIVGSTNAPKLVSVAHPWTANSLLILHSDGIEPRWQWDEPADFAHETPAKIATRLLSRYARIEDDATVLVVRTARVAAETAAHNPP